MLEIQRGPSSDPSLRTEEPTDNGTAEHNLGDGNSKVKLGQLQPWERGGRGTNFSMFRKLLSGSLWAVSQRDKAAQGARVFSEVLPFSKG